MAIYCIDTSSLINLKYYPQPTFRSLWNNLEELINDGELISVREVHREIKKKEDMIANWAKNNARLFINPDDRQIDYVKDIMTKFPNFVDANKTTPEADPFVIAIARCNKGIVISDEKKAAPNPNARPRIPNVCDYYHIECLKLFEFFEREHWQF